MGMNINTNSRISLPIGNCLQGKKIQRGKTTLKSEEVGSRERLDANKLNEGH